MKQVVKVVIIMPVGPAGSKNRFEDICDTIQSIRYYTDADRRIIIEDNSHPLHLGERLQAIFPDLLVVRSPRNYGIYGGLYYTLSLAIQHVHTAFDFQALIKMDTDALFIDHGFADAVIQYFAAHPNTGLIGNLLNQGEGIDWASRQIKRQTGALMWMRARKRTDVLRKLVQKAQGHNYQLGEHVLGGSYIFNPRMVDKMVNQGLLLRHEIADMFLGEDQIFGLLCKAVGMELGDFHTDPYPIAVEWKGLTDSPEALVKRGKKVIHSVRFWKDMNEEQIRTFFRNRRMEQPMPEVQLLRNR